MRLRWNYKTTESGSLRRVAQEIRSGETLKCLLQCGLQKERRAFSEEASGTDRRKQARDMVGLCTVNGVGDTRRRGRVHHRQDGMIKRE